MLTPPSPAADPIDSLVPLPAHHPVQALRHQRDKVVAATQGSDRALFDTSITRPSLAERLLVAHQVARRAGSAALQAHYRSRLLALPTLTALQRRALDDSSAPLAGELRLHALLAFASTLTERPAIADRAALLTLPAAGLDTPEVVLVAQLIAYVAYQLRVIAGLQAMVANATAFDTAFDAASRRPEPETPFVHPAHLPKPGQPVRVNGFTSETLGWKSWLPVVDLDTATPEQLAVLEASHPQARTSDYYRLLAHQPAVLEQRSIVFNAIMYAPGGLSRAERELASAVVSRVNGCIYCASVHAQRFEQLARRNDVIHQLFTEPDGAGTTARERALVQLAIALTRSPANFGAGDLGAVLAAGLSALEVLDLLHAVAIFAWANRLMLNLGEPVQPG